MRNFLFLCLLVLAGCVTVRQISIESIEAEANPEPPVVVESPVKAHLNDGSTVMFPKGLTVQGTEIRGEGFKYDITLENSEPVTKIDLVDVAAMESFTDDVNEGATIAATTVTTIAGGYAVAGLAKAIFGSCPTTYTLDSEEPTLEAESFSYSIAPGFEARDVDRLSIGSVEQGHIVLEMRNEALETHYINHVELLEVSHAHDERAYPDVTGRPITVSDPAAAVSAVDRDGVSVVGIERGRDGSDWGTSESRLHQASLKDLHDHIDLEFETSPTIPRHALVLRIRNSLLNTVLLYDVMLKGQGVRALDWMVRDLDRLGPRYQLAKWYRKEMGMDVLVWNGKEYRNVAKIADTGPIAWKEVAVPLPEVKGDTVKLRLQFIADNWRIDQISLAAMSKPREVKAIPVDKAVDVAGNELPAVRAHLHRDDGDYVVTRPAESMRLHFDVGEPRNGMTRTWLFAAEGYYIEWMRREWLDNREEQAFEPNNEAIIAAIELWKPRRDTLREQFEATKIRVR